MAFIVAVVLSVAFGTIRGLSTIQRFDKTLFELNEMYEKFMQMKEELGSCRAESVTEVAPSAGRNRDRTCPKDYIGFQGKCYFINSEPLSWEGAQSYCLQHGGSLVMIKTKAQQEFLAEHIAFTGKSYWVGMEWFRGKLVWWDGTPVRYSNWAEDFPVCGETECKTLLSKHYDYKWANDLDIQSMASICEKRISRG